MTGGEGPWDRGSQAERTSMAWVRTSVAILVAAGTVTRLSILDEARWGEALGLVACLLCLVSVTLSWLHSRRTRAASDGTVTLVPAVPVAVLSVVAAVSCVGAATFGLGLSALLH